MDVPGCPNKSFDKTVNPTALEKKINEDNR